MFSSFLGFETGFLEVKSVRKLHLKAAPEGITRRLPLKTSPEEFI
jgi:hypothetical protein